jgi:hypothetical protein
MRRFRRGFAAALFLGATAIALAGDVVVLKGGSVIPLKGPWVRRGNTAYLTRPDGTVLSVAVSEIDREATDAARARAAAPPPVPVPEAAPATPAEAARVTSDAPKARVRITDADVSHPLDLSAPTVAEEKEKEQKALKPGSARVEMAGYEQKKDGAALVVTGQLRNPTQVTAENVRMSLTVMDEKGEPIEGAEASLSNGEIESGSTISFTAKVNIGDKTPASIRFAPTWTQPKPVPTPRPLSPAALRAASAAQNVPAN